MDIFKISPINFGGISNFYKNNKNKKEQSLGEDISSKKDLAYPKDYYSKQISFTGLNGIKAKKPAVITLAMFAALAQCENIQEVKENFKDNYFLKDIKDKKTLKDEFESHKLKIKNGTLTEQDKKSDLAKVYGFLKNVDDGKKPNFTLDNLTLKLVKEYFGAYGKFTKKEDLAGFLKIKKIKLNPLFRYLGIKDFNYKSTEISREQNSLIKKAYYDNETQIGKGNREKACEIMKQVYDINTERGQKIRKIKSQKMIVNYDINTTKGKNLRKIRRERMVKLHDTNTEEGLKIRENKSKKEILFYESRPYIGLSKRFVYFQLPEKEQEKVRAALSSAYKLKQRRIYNGEALKNYDILCQPVFKDIIKLAKDFKIESVSIKMYKNQEITPEEKLRIKNFYLACNQRFPGFLNCIKEDYPHRSFLIEQGLISD